MYKATSNEARGFPLDPHAICGHSKLSISEHFLMYHLLIGYSFKPKVEVKGILENETQLKS